MQFYDSGYFRLKLYFLYIHGSVSLKLNLFFFLFSFFLNQINKIRTPEHVNVHRNLNKISSGFISIQIHDKRPLDMSHVIIASLFFFFFFVIDYTANDSSLTYYTEKMRRKISFHTNIQSCTICIADHVPLIDVQVTAKLNP